MSFICHLSVPHTPAGNERNRPEKGEDRPEQRGSAVSHRCQKITLPLSSSDGAALGKGFLRAVLPRGAKDHLMLFVLFCFLKLLTRYKSNKYNPNKEIKIQYKRF